MIEHIVIFVSGSFLVISFVLICLIFIQKRRHENHLKNIQLARTYLVKKYMDKAPTKRQISKRFFFDALIDVDEQILLEPNVRQLIIHDLKQTAFVKKMIRALHAHRAYRRKIAIFYVSQLKTDDAYELLMKRFNIEKKEAVKLTILYHLGSGFDEKALHDIMMSLKNSSVVYQQRVATLIGSKYKHLFQYLYPYTKEEDDEIKMALINMCQFQLDSKMAQYFIQYFKTLINKPSLSNQEKLQLEGILKAILTFMPEHLHEPSLLNHANEMCRLYAIKSYQYQPSVVNLKQLIVSFDQTALDDVRLESISQMIFNDQTLFDDLLDLFPQLSKDQKQKVVAIINERLHYVILKLFKSQQQQLKEILTLLIHAQMIESLIDFVNQNKDVYVANCIDDVIRQEASQNPLFLKQLRLYLHKDQLARLSLQPLVLKQPKRKRAPIEKNKIKWIFKWLMVATLLFPIIYILIHIKTIWTTPWSLILKGYVIDVNIYLIAYFGVINIIYMLLLVLSLVGSSRETHLSANRKRTLLFSDKVLPGISIIAPAYNESKSIIESVTSLLNLTYPTYEVIVVNDGSRDDTLKILIDHFELERKHVAKQFALDTKPIKGVYRTKRIPNLIVVDKENGGKADALNVGINLSRQDFVCGIDADSILEGDALLKLASVMLEDTKTHIALGGNIYPANGFTFDKGKAEKRALPKEHVARLQTIEYLRAFTSGRIGWSMMKSLMIISGAFGLFKKDLLIETGGYLTSSSKLKKDTVGEDMELVVRLTREALERKENYKVSYVYDAYCYTELPSDMKTLLKQRNRWQRGLIDILSYHRKIGFNVNYKQIGLIGYPYFFIFEFLGPFFEVHGYLMLLIGLVFGWLSTTIILAIFAMSILFGVVISLASLYMSEKEIHMMTRKELLLMIGYAILENFGYRQWVSMHRVMSTFSAIRETGSWGAMKRKGFAQDKRVD